MPVAARRRFDFDVAVHLALAGEPQLLLVADSPEEQQRAGQNAEAFPQAGLADILLALGDQHFATATLAKAQAVQHFVRSPIERDAIFESDLSQVAARFDVDALLLVDESDLGHDALGSRFLEVVNGAG